MNSELNKKALLHGAIIGSVGIAISIIAYLISDDAYFSWRSITLMIVSFSLLIHLGRKERKTNHEGFLSFAEAFWYCSITMFITIYCNEIFYIFVFNVLNPALQDVFIAQSIESTEQMLMIFEKDMSKIDESISEIERQVRNSFKPFSLIANSWQILTQAMIVGLIGALFIKKSKPLFEED
ncbi:DUF4199 domain-containing protein [Reichenbachiella agarivorans]|uniref:DUF4199 domain-containing protein n=1 Tax=Reichenbachiella agarivorans TaxID=2979464 RepID=A0ABY6CU19_9BACT|nr:DUF4199 domain-containing protein [Reichenbachiella agarivorans]UXP34010.1 DUF4199 domain-containing protein [Reichenbachiella agarivorans]